jgi:ATP-binding cassette, subfamily C (CFTR/MRP), member 2
MKDGKITQAGKYDDILKLDSDLMELVGAHREALSMLDSVEAGSTSLNEDSSGIEIANKDVRKLEIRDGQNSKADDTLGENGQLVQEEEREKGRVGFRIYWKYLTTAYRGRLVPLILVAEILFQLLQVGSNYWMAKAAPVSKDVAPLVGGSTLILVYVALSIGSSFCVLVRALLLAAAGYKTAQLLFSKMHLAIFRAPMSFFDATPSGRILNRVRDFVFSILLLL